MHSRGWRRFPRTFTRAATSAGRWTLDFVYPPACSLCGQPLLNSTARPQRLCVQCRNEVAPVLPHRCLRCSAPAGPHLDTSNGCIHCRADRFAFEKVLSLGAYDGSLREACLQVKRQSGSVVAVALAGLLVEQEFMESGYGQPGFDLVVPVPHHWTDRIRQNHLPPVTLATCVARLLSVPCAAHILAKVRRTRPQTELSHTERRKNLRGAFRLIGRPDLTGRQVLLVDDVLTTGTTAHRAATELKRAGAVITVAVLARGLGPGAPTGPRAGAGSEPNHTPS